MVTFFSPKGGAGKTVLACNLAATFARQQQRKTLLLDLDLQFGDAAIMMGIEPEKTIYDLVMARRELDSDALAGYVTAHSVRASTCCPRRFGRRMRSSSPRSASATCSPWPRRATT